ncbi:putative efflux pump membrane fusion protein [Kingella potus]|uniref:Putative efflux pump membrane fusion protein n=1 Tax=Kingella potus TaxID=265175 RepID=A0A377R6R8_9NEIS|nr:HlyD family efflux transporter periplasmic adaptor subunit [Kingella potus]UOO99980.1 HlyD family efflux transporter periplasmic adaptor subunit [Kingella potus]STR03265.1 putative efflux pump membrane fusion protein [Kingella potus]
MKKAIWLLLAAASAAGGFFYYRAHEAGSLPAGIASSNGRLELNRIDVASLYPGRVKTVNVEEGADVAAGDILAELSSDTSSSRLEEAQAAELRQRESVRRAQAAGEQMRRTVARAQANVEAARQQRKVAKMEWDNARKMLSDHLVSQAEAERRRADYERAAAAVKAAEAAQAEAQSTVAQSLAAQAEAQAGTRQAAAAVKSAAAANDDMNIRAPIAGRVEYKIAEAGNVVASGSKVVSLLDPSDVSMSIFLPNHDAGRLKVGGEARIRLDSIDAVFPAQVKFIATDAQFTPKSVETENERAKLMFKVRLKIPADTAVKYKGLLKGGMTGNGYVKTDDKAEWPQDLAVRLPQ